MASRALSFALSVLVARKLGASGFGAFAVVWYAAWMVSQATDLGVHLVTLRGLSRSSRGAGGAVLAAAVGVKGLLTAVVAIATLGLGRGEWVVALFLAAHLASSWVELSGVVLRSRGQIAREGLLLFVLRASWLVSALWVLSAGAELESLAAVLALSSVPALALAGALLSRGGTLRRFEGGEARRLVREALPLALGSIITLLYLRVDLLVVAFLRDATEAGLFQGAFRLFEATFVLSGGIAAGTFPFLAARVGKAGFGSSSRFVLVLLLALALPLASLFAFGAEPLLLLLYGSDFRDASGPLSVLGLGLVAVFVNALTTHLLVASGRSRRYVLATAVRLVVAVALDFLLVPAWGALGAAVAVAAAEWTLAAVTLPSVADLLGAPLARLSPKEASS